MPEILLRKGLSTPTDLVSEFGQVIIIQRHLVAGRQVSLYNTLFIIYKRRAKIFSTGRLLIFALFPVLSSLNCLLFFFLAC